MLNPLLMVLALPLFGGCIAWLLNCSAFATREPSSGAELCACVMLIMSQLSKNHIGVVGIDWQLGKWIYNLVRYRSRGQA
jgi:hypothetical protein